MCGQQSPVEPGQQSPAEPVPFYNQIEMCGQQSPVEPVTQPTCPKMHVVLFIQKI